MMALLVIGAAALSLPAIDHQKGVRVRPKDLSVIMCASPTALPLVRIADELTQPVGPDYGLDKLMQDGGCVPVLTTATMIADFEEDVVWAGSIRPPKMLRGKLRVVRVRFALAGVAPGLSGVEAYYYVAADDLVVAR